MRQWLEPIEGNKAMTERHTVDDDTDMHDFFLLAYGECLSVPGGQGARFNQLPFTRVLHTSHLHHL